MWTLVRLLEAVSWLLLHPEPNSPLNCDAANLLRINDKRGYASLAQYYTVKYAHE
jgi:peroxin-4